MPTTRALRSPVALPLRATPYAATREGYRLFRTLNVAEDRGSLENQLETLKGRPGRSAKLLRQSTGPVILMKPGFELVRKAAQVNTSAFLNSFFGLCNFIL